MPKYLIYLTEEPRSAYLDFYGHSGKAYRFEWSEQHRCMVLYGREVTGEEFDAVSEDIFSASPEQNFCRPVPKRIPAEGEAKPEAPKQPAAPAAAPASTGADIET